MRSLELLEGYYKASTGAKEHPSSEVVLPCIIAALSSPAEAVRIAALATLQAAAAAAKALSALAVADAERVPTAAALSALSAAVRAAHAAIVGDSSAAVIAIRKLFAGRQGSKKETAAKKGHALGSGPAATPGSDELAKFFLVALGAQAGPTGTRAADLLLKCLSGVVDPAQLLVAALPLLRPAFAGGASSAEVSLAAEAVGLFSVESLASVKGHANKVACTDALVAALSLPGVEDPNPAIPWRVRTAALKCLSAELFNGLDESVQSSVLKVGSGMRSLFVLLGPGGEGFLFCQEEAV